MNRQFTAFLAVLLILGIFLGLNIFSDRAITTSRIDLTEEKLFTLSDGSKNIAAGLKEPITLTLYFSSKAAQGTGPFASYGKRVQELLQEFQRNSRNKITLKIVDPLPDSEDETKASAAGLVPMSAGRDPVYLGILGTNSVDGTDVIPALNPAEEKFLEYKIAKLIYALNAPKKHVIGLMTPLPINQAFRINPQTGQPEPARVAQFLVELRSLFEIKDVAVDAAEIPRDIDVLMVIHPKNITDTTLFAIDQYVLNGGRLLALADPYCEADNPPNARNQMEALMARRDSNLNKLLNAWGLETIEDRLATDISRAIGVSSGNTRESIPYVAWMDMRPDKENPASGDFSTTDLVTSNLSRVIIPTAGIIQERANRGAGPWPTFTPLIQTSDQAAQLETAKIQGAPDTKKLIAEYIPGTKRLTVAARIAGKARTAFPAGKPAPATKDPAKPEEPKKEESPALTESKQDINVIFIADADFIQERFWMQEDRMFGAIAFANNADLISNAIDNLSGSSDLISIRARGDSNRPFTRVNDMLTEAQKKYRASEDALQQQVQQTRAKIEEIQRSRPDQKDAAIILTPQQQAEIAKLRKDAAETDKKLRQVRFELAKDVETLGVKLKAINIGLMAGIVVLFALLIGWFRANRRRSARALN